MTRFTVVWIEEVQNTLATIWMGALDRQAVTSAADMIDAELAIDPNTKGTEVAEGLRVLYVPPLQVLFSVQEQDRLVEVSGIRCDSPPFPNLQTSGDGEVQP
ncbi:MAG: hypothetical protein JO112_21935 [Planctomycetes bacterium]|nr:hypothetical protein [Planctomycetota bacterium]